MDQVEIWEEDTVVVLADFMAVVLADFSEDLEALVECLVSEWEGVLLEEDQVWGV
jgi:hypothetical protein